MDSKLLLALGSVLSLLAVSNASFSFTPGTRPRFIRGNTVHFDQDDEENTGQSSWVSPFRHRKGGSTGGGCSGCGGGGGYGGGLEEGDDAEEVVVKTLLVGKNKNNMGGLFEENDEQMIFIGGRSRFGGGGRSFEESEVLGDDLVDIISKKKALKRHKFDKTGSNRPLYRFHKESKRGE